MLKYHKRINQLGLKEGPNVNLYAYRSHGKPCSCVLCRGEKYSRMKEAISLAKSRNVLNAD